MSENLENTPVFFDAHFHIIDFNFTVVKNKGYLPPPYHVLNYQEETSHLQLTGGAVVSGSFQGFDQQYLISALQQLGPGFCGVTQLPSSVTDSDIIYLHSKGIRGLRFNVKRGGSESLSKLEYLAKRVYDLVGWHVELYIDATNIPDIAFLIERLPAVSIDHLGLSEKGLPHLLRLVDKGIRVKATGFGRVNLNIEHALKAIYSTNPNALMFGTDLPSTRAKRRFKDSDIRLIQQLFDWQAVNQIMYKNALAWYFK